MKKEVRQLEARGFDHKAPEIPDHEVLRMIGRGAYGEIWLARSLTGALRAVKVVSRSTFESERSFMREFEGMARFEPISRAHEGFVDILHVGRNEAFFYYIMELADDSLTGLQIDGSQAADAFERYVPKTFRTVLQTRADFPPRNAPGSALSHRCPPGAAQARLTHRDIKPANIIFVKGEPKLADIGLVAASGQRSFVGTEGYVPRRAPDPAGRSLQPRKSPLRDQHGQGPPRFPRGDHPAR